MVKANLQLHFQTSKHIKWFQSLFTSKAFRNLKSSKIQRFLISKPLDFFEFYGLKKLKTIQKEEDHHHKGGGGVKTK
jgi:hypothetical protein